MTDTQESVGASAPTIEAAPAATEPASAPASAQPASAPAPSEERSSYSRPRPVRKPKVKMKRPVTAKDSNRYETLLLLYKRFDGDSLDKLKAEVTKALESHGATDISNSDIGKKKLAYKIKDQSDGVYVNFIYSGKRKALADFEKWLRLNDDIIRFLTTVVDWE
ncbi:MAG: 30S ribosomal protein S6 [Candidatus Lindowbacteria bacterium]|nr:30S ribosomal protein S6 [Candidatus Lindowbacteria bacterium]